MSARLVLVITVDDSIGELNSKIHRPGKQREAVQNCINHLTALGAGMKSGTVQITTRDSDPSVTTSGTDSTQETHTLG